MLKKLIAVAKGVEKAHLILKNLNIVNVFSGNIKKGDIAIYDGFIAGIGNYDNSDNIIDCHNKLAMPGFIDSHVHIESTHLTPSEFAKAVIPCGTTTVIADPHEIANVCGIDGIKYIYNESKKLPLDILIMFPSCVPATPFETSGATLSSVDMDKYLNSEMFFGVGEFMNYPGVINADNEVIKKIECAIKYNKIVDGHSAGVSGKDLNAYIASGIKTDHECTTVEEMLEKIDKGMYVQIREGSATRNLETLIKGVNNYNYKRCLMCTDDKTPFDLITKGHIDNNIRLAVKNGLPIMQAVAMATINAAECYGLKNTGALSMGYYADIVICDDIENLNICQVYKKGLLVAKNKQPLFNCTPDVPKNVLNTINTKKVNADNFKFNLKSDKVKVIKLIEKNVVTEKVIKKVDVCKGDFIPNKNLSKIAVVERHKNSGNIGLGILEGYNIQNGAVAITVAHDSHNIIVVGDNNIDMAVAVNGVISCDGGIAIASENKLLKTLPLEIAGLITTKTAKQFSDDYFEICEIAEKLEINKNIEPFMSLSFMSLSVIPHIKLTDKGLFDVDIFGFTDLEA